MAVTFAWISVASQMPPEGVVVNTAIHDWDGARLEQRLFRRGNLWLVEDGSMYVYYQPTHWKPL